MTSNLRNSLNRLSDYSDESLLKEIRRVSESFGGAKFTIQEFEQRARCSYAIYAIIKKRFGGLAAAVEKAGLEQRYFARNISEKDLLDELERVWLLVLENEGRRLYRDDLKTYGAKYSAGPYYERWGIWISACEAALDRSEVDYEPSDETPESQTNYMPRKTEKRPIPFLISPDVQP